MTLEIDINQLADFLNVQLSYLKEHFGNIIKIDKGDYYETGSSRYNAEMSEDIEVGNLSDDWAFIKTSHSRGDPANPYQLIHVAPIIRRLAEQYVERL